MQLWRSAPLLALLVTCTGCERFERWLFERHSPTVDRAITAIESKDAGDAHALLADYLSTGRCKAGTLGTPDSLRALPHAGLDLGLALFELGERYGQKFGEEPPNENDPAATGPELAKRSQKVDCAQRLVRVIAADNSLPVTTRAEAYYLSGNLEFLRHDYVSAVASYDDALGLIPAGGPDAGRDIAERAAWNRAIAQRRAEEQKPEPPPPTDAGAPPSGDAGAEQDDSKTGEQEPEQKEPEQEPKDPEQEQQDREEQEQEPEESDGEQAQQEEPSPSNTGSAEPTPPASAAPPERPSLSQDEQILEMLERAPLIQQEQPKTRGRVLGRLPMEDK